MRAVLLAGVVSLSLGLIACAPSTPREGALPRLDIAAQMRTVAAPATHDSELRHPGRRGPLTTSEMNMARIAWRYFENNYQENTGLVNAVQDYPSVTLWDTASYMSGMLAALEFGIIGRGTFDRRFSKLLGTLNTLPLFRDEVPNKVYNTQTAELVDYQNQPGEVGFSALDLGRLLIWLRIYKERFPAYAAAIDRSVLRWRFCNMIDQRGMMFGAFVDPASNETRYVQEGRLGYEEYAAKGFELWGFDTTLAAMAEPFELVPMHGVDIPYDRRDPRLLDAHNYVVTESYVLDGIEFNWDLALDNDSPDDVHTHGWMADFAQRIYRVQENRYRETGIITARTEHQLDEAPFFVYDTIYSNGRRWNTLTDQGEYAPRFAAVAAKGALGLWVLWDTPYTDLLFNHIANLNRPDRGYYEGSYEDGRGPVATFTANNNGIMLATLLYKTSGKLVRLKGEESFWDLELRDPFSSYKDGRRCLPCVP